jgi:hypothetical protein
MSEVVEILQQNIQYRLDDPQNIVSEDAIHAIEKQLGVALPAEYVEFCLLGGLNDLQFQHTVLSPGAIVTHAQSVSDQSLVPFASNGCGDLFCWRKNMQEIMFWEHDNGTVSPIEGTFIQWLKDNRM